MILEVALARALAYSTAGEVHEGFAVIENDIYSNSRWSLNFYLVIKEIATDKYWKSYYSVGATEMQDEQPFEYDEPSFTEVEPFSAVVTKYRKVK